VALSLKIAELKLVREAIDEEPVVVMDDVFAELDRQRVARLLEMVLPDRQVLIATTEAERLSPAAVQGATCFAVRAGEVKSEK
jgi:DNA replication and repair protein RecF